MIGGIVSIFTDVANNEAYVSDGKGKVTKINVDPSKLEAGKAVLKQLLDSTKILKELVESVNGITKSAKSGQEEGGKVGTPLIMMSDGITAIMESIKAKGLEEKSVNNFRTIADQFVKLANTTDKFKTFKDSFKEFGKDFEQFTKNLNSIDIQKLTGWTEYNKVTLEILKQPDSNDLHNFQEAMTAIMNAFFEGIANHSNNVISGMGNANMELMAGFKGIMGSSSSGEVGGSHDLLEGYSKKVGVKFWKDDKGADQKGISQDQAIGEILDVLYNMLGSGIRIRP